VGLNERTIGVVNYWKQINFLRGKFFEKWNLTGDGTVPLRSAEIVTLTKRKADYYIKNEKHEKLPSSEAGIEIIRGLLKEPAETLFAMPDKIYYDPPESYALSVWQAFVSSPVSLHAYDTQGNHTGSITDTSWEANIPNSEYFHGDLRDPHSPKGVLLSPDEDYSLEIISLDTTSSFDLVIDKIINGYSMATVYFDSVVILNQTTAICSLNTSTQIIELEIDFDGDGIIDTVIAPIILTNVENENNSSLLPKDYMLSQNYPNPFNPTTKITYALPKSSLVQIKIFNLLGQEIATLVNEEKSAGFYEMDFNASDLPSGVYLYKLQAGDFVQTKKMILLK
ncbi:MAG: T9SS type A sorting domain-containing protein, partial [Ignavibacteria bacterium]|nr:T9SS type A sorting domain-containing protein [Ignavibacteria bacterium]